MSIDIGKLDAIRRQQSELENQAIDELAAGRIDRRGFLRYGSAIGLSAGVMAATLSALGLVPGAMPQASAAPSDDTIRAANIVPTGAIDPVTVADSGGLLMLQQVGEFLARDGADLRLSPALATSWQPNQDGSVWTFTLRPGVTFHDGSPMTADDVVASIERLANPKNGSSALSVFKGVLSAGGTRKVDDHTVAFHLDGSCGNFPYYVSSDNYNAIIMPKSYKGDFEQSWVGTGPFRIEKYTPKVGASFTRFDGYWGPKALPRRTAFSFYQDLQSEVLALQGKEVDLIVEIAVQGGQALLHDPEVAIIALRSASHEELHMRCDLPPFTDKRVRRALALTLDRPALVKGLFQGQADIGNDSPFAPIYPSTNGSVPERRQNVALAKQLLAAAGHPDGFDVRLTTEKFIMIPQYAELVQDFARRAGIRITLKVESQGAYYGKAVFGQSDWLDSIVAITDYGHRGVPNVYLSAALSSGGPWNAAHFKDPAYDRLVAQYVAALDLEAQRAASGKIETLLLDETPVIFAYFNNYLAAVRKNLKGVAPTAISQCYLDRAHFV
ncbi:MAG: ABC transporter substrate-binding protein [Acetobacteraceae bacterium]